MSVLSLDYPQTPRPTARPTWQRGGKEHRQSKAPQLPAGPRCSVLWGWTSATSPAMEPQGSHPPSRATACLGPPLAGRWRESGEVRGRPRFALTGDFQVYTLASHICQVLKTSEGPRSHLSHRRRQGWEMPSRTQCEKIPSLRRYQSQRPAGGRGLPVRGGRSGRRAPTRCRTPNQVLEPPPQLCSGTDGPT